MICDHELDGLRRIDLALAARLLGDLLQEMIHQQRHVLAPLAQAINFQWPGNVSYNFV